MSNYMEEAFAPAESRHRQAVLADTWGHLDPKRNNKYAARVVYAVGCFGSDCLNPTVIASEFEDLDSSPWFFDSLQDFLSESAPHGDDEVGCVYEWIGTFRNYKFKGTFRLILNANIK